jgi:putative colanic acid biosynthesis acetyltransferase WcaF
MAEKNAPETSDAATDQSQVQVVKLSDAPGEHAAWDRPKRVIYLWAIFEWLFITNSLQISSRIRVSVLRLFGAEIGDGVVFRPRTRVKFPWKLHVGSDCWIGEGVWFHNQDHIYIGHDVVISQESFLTTGSHAHRRNMALITRPITIEDGVWITTRCIILGGAKIRRSALITPNSVVSGEIDANRIWGSSPGPSDLGPRLGTRI